MFAGSPAPFVMELPSYHAPVVTNVLKTTWDRAWGFIKRAGTVIVVASLVIWVLNSLTFENGFHYIGDGDETSILNLMGSVVASIFTPIGFDKWEAAVATVLGLVAKEEVVGVFGSLSETGNAESAFALIFEGSRLAAFSFMIFNLLCAPCFAAMGAIKREMNNGKWTTFSIGYMCVFAYAISLIVYRLGLLITNGVFDIWTVMAFVVLAALLYMLFRKNKYAEK